jgi:hypothetical protein
VKSGLAERGNGTRWLASFDGIAIAHRMVIIEPICVEPDQSEPMPPKEEMESYYAQDHATSMLIEAMASIGQTYQRGGNYGPYGGYEIVVVRTDTVGSIRRAIIGALMWMIECVCPMPIETNSSGTLQDDEAR